MVAGMIPTLSRQLGVLRKLPTALRYGLTLLMVLTALALIMAMPKGQSYPFLMFFPVILITAVILDHGCSIFATLFAAVLALYYLIQPAGSLAPADSRDLLWLLLFVLVGLSIGIVVEAMRHAVEALSLANDALRRAQADLKDQTALFDAVLEGYPDPIYAKDRDGRFVHVNSGAARLLAVPIDTIPGNRDRDFLPAEVAAEIEANDHAIVTSGTMRTVEERVGVTGAPLQTYLSTKFPWRDATGGTIGLIGISRDISDRKAAEDALKAADAQKQLLLFDINHRIKNHLQSVMGVLSLGARRAATLDEARAALDNGAGRLAVLGRVYDRLELGRGASVVDARSFIVELCSDLKLGLIGDRPVAILCSSVTASIEADRAVMLGMAVNELVQNALKYAFPADRAGIVGVDFVVDDRDYLLTVGDDGIGFDPAAAPQGGGTGSRLLRAMARQLRGSLTITGEQGTRAELRFPVADVADYPA